jgi:hypothetical protein
LAAVADTRTEPKRRETAERRQLMLSELVGSTALSARTRPEDLSEASPVSSPFRPAEMIGGGFLRSPQAPTFSPTAADDRHDGDIQAAETGEAYADYDDLPSPRWRGRLGTAIVVLCLAGLGAGAHLPIAPCWRARNCRRFHRSSKPKMASRILAMPSRAVRAKRP